MKENCLAVKRPHLIKEWHSSKNGVLTPYDVTFASSKKVWWQCVKEHEWKATANDRSRGSGCPGCSGRKAYRDNCLAALDPKLAAEWHPTKNGDLTSFDVTPGSNKKVWWLCFKFHEWEATTNNRSNGRGCSCCSGRKVCKDNCLATLNSELTKEWHPTKNGYLTSSDITPFCNKKVWWICLEKKHEWETTIFNRSNGNGCPGCSGRKAYSDNCLATLNPELAKEWHPMKNGNLTPFDVTVGSGKKVWWLCLLKNHEWEAAVDTRSKGHSCPGCSGRKAYLDNCLATLNPELSKEWHPMKNEDLTPSGVTVGSGKKVWWLCLKKGHEWRAIVSNRSNCTNCTDCPYCANQKVCEDNCLATLNPELAKEWHPVKNGNLTPSDVIVSSNKKVWWECSKEHEWEASISHRNRDTGCPYCSRFKTENRCRTLLEDICGKPFPKNRKVLDCRLELDGYCDELELAFEYNGKQHYKFIQYWHKTQENFEKAQARDRLKARLCEEKGIRLIVIPYTENHRLEEFIREHIRV